MILDTMAQAARYEAIHPRFKAAFDFIRNTDLSAIEVGRYEIDGTDVFALVQSYPSKAIEEKVFEAHKNYIDIQYIIEGVEMMGYTLPEKLTVQTPYNPEKDCEFYDHAEMTECIVESGTYAIFFPEDPHKPGCTVSGKAASNVKKLVLKIKL
ncbi:DUF386 domain-containing protein [Oceanispirochaeta crateris]|uniref:DUF386 domain-containing protein n=1 Tax=Oceanispirochaeta crateris TaxID=2518645 RepID=A0A5C1QNA2_9SPIO|nr:YhcH/YjgK/YiaL family protein [Oceanispirochaeta crateris]QEN09575.1 DUF386 domain-containing protein [Oceanispirochaeta crateris]